MERSTDFDVSSGIARGAALTVMDWGHPQAVGLPQAHYHEDCDP
jgi:hypothetical protein